MCLFIFSGFLNESILFQFKNRSGRFITKITAAKNCRQVIVMVLDNNTDSSRPQPSYNIKLYFLQNKYKKVSKCMAFCNLVDLDS